MYWCPVCETDGSGRFCMACGGKLQEKQTTITVVNGPSKLEDGSVCNNELKPDVAYCSNCGTKVDKTLFKPKKNICSKCNLELQPDAKFCGQCGTKVLRKDEAHVGTTKLEGSNKDNKGDTQSTSQAGDLSKGEKTVPTKERESENKNSAIGDSLNDRVDKEKNASTEHSDDDSKSSNEPVLEGNNLPLERIEEKIDSSIVRDNKELSKEANADENKTENESAETDKLFENEDAKESCESSKTVANEGTEAVQDNANKDIFSSKGGAKAEPNLSRDVDNKTIEFSKGAAVEDETVQLIEGTDKNTGLANDFEVEIIGKTTKSVEKDTKANTNQTSKTETEEQRKDGDADKTNQGSTQNAKKPALKDPDTIIESLVSAYNAAAGEGRKKSTQAVAQKEQEKPDQRQTRSQTQKTNINDAQTAKGEGTSKTKSQQNKRNTDEKMVRVCFHALLQGDIEEKKERLVLMSGDTQFGGWRYTNNKVELKRNYEEAYYEVRYERDLPISLLLRGFSYKYCIVKNGSKSYEAYYTRRKDSNRIFHINDEDKAKVKVMKVCKINNPKITADEQQFICEQLLVRPLEEQKTCVQVQFIDQHYQKYRHLFGAALVAFMHYVACGKEKNPSWMLILPLVHFLTDLNSPFELPTTEVGHDGQEPTWWGIRCPSMKENNGLLTEAFEKFKSNLSTWKMSLQAIVEKLEPLFRVDCLLPRSLIASLELMEVQEVVELNKLPVYVCAANLNSFLKSIKQRYDQSEMTRVCSSITKLSESMAAFPDVTDFSLENLTKANIDHKVAADLLKSSLTFSHLRQPQAPCVQLLLQTLSKYHGLYQSALAKNEISDGNFEDPQTIVDSVLAMVLDWNRRVQRPAHETLRQFLKNWNKMMAPDDLSKSIKHRWNEAIGKELYAFFSRNFSTKSYLPSLFMTVYCSEHESFTGSMQDVLSQIASKAVEAGYSPDVGTFHDSQRERFGYLLSEMFVKQWNSVMKSADGKYDDKILELILTWQPFSSFLKILRIISAPEVKFVHGFSTMPQKLVLLVDLAMIRDIMAETGTTFSLTEGCQQGLAMAASFIEHSNIALENGSITVENVNSLQQQADKFAIVSALSKKATYEDTYKLIQLRCKEINAVKEKTELVTKFTTLCHLLKKVDMTKVNETLVKMASIERYGLSEFCKTQAITAVENIELCQPVVTAFDLPDAIETILMPLADAFQSSVFRQLWENQCNQCVDECTSLELIPRLIWKPVSERWHALINQIDTGKISFNDFERLIGKIYQENYDNMRQELITMALKGQKVDGRIKQLQQYRQVERSVQGAKDILQLATLYSLEGEFDQIRNIASHGDTQLEMKSFDVSMMGACRLLKDITKEKSECISALVKADPLVKWLKGTMKKKGLKELKVFVDLALISAGEQPMDIDKVQALNTAVLGYSALIFDLTPDSDYDALIRKCQQVWKELETNRDLPQKLIDSYRNLEWLKEIQKAHGSVEVTSLGQAEAINSTGVYTVGYIKDTQFPAPSDVLRLRVTNKVDNRTETRNYTFDHLQDLQSRLMLVAGRAERDKAQGKDEVEKFTEVFDGMKRLANVYIKLHNAGCVLFKTWSAEFICDPTTPVCALLVFGEGVETLKGRRTKTEDAGVIIRRVARFLEACLDKWLKYISNQRYSNLHLNYFTIDQLVELQREIVKVGTHDQPDSLIYPLLSAVKTNCSPKDLTEAVLGSQEQIDELDNEQIELKKSTVDPQDDKGLQKRTFIREMVDAGYSEALALKALDELQPDQIDDGIVWCMDHENDVTAEEDFHGGEQTHSFVNVPVPTWSRTVDTVLSITSSYVGQLVYSRRDFGVEPLIQNLESLWSTFLESISSNLKDYVTLGHLGMILQILSEKDPGTVDRKTFTKNFKTGVPNLIIVPSEDVLNTVLTIYMMDDDQPLPQSDEVLLCNQDTRIDEVDIFWRRAIFDGGSKIHCLVNADLLDFDVADQAEKLLEECMERSNQAEPNYRLVVMCGADNEYRSKIVAALDKFKRSALPIKVHAIAKYLEGKLQAPTTCEDSLCAADVDFNRLLKGVHSMQRSGTEATRTQLQPSEPKREITNITNSQNTKITYGQPSEQLRSCVRVLKSYRAGVGKSLYANRRIEQLYRMVGNNQGIDVNGVKQTLNDDRIMSIKIPLQEKVIDVDTFCSILLQHTTLPENSFPRIFHIDISYEVHEGVDYLLFNLLVLQCLTNKAGHVWRRSEKDMYLIENMPILKQKEGKSDDKTFLHSILAILPSMTCHSPTESLAVYNGKNSAGYHEEDQLFDRKMMQADDFQRTYRNLSKLDSQKADIESEKECLKLLLRHCGIPDPSWSELHHFVQFLNTQLKSYETNNFIVSAGEDLKGFDKFALKFLIQMSRDFSTRSLNMSEETPTLEAQTGGVIGTTMVNDATDLHRFQLRRTWESSPHPYLFFNSDDETFTFLGFNIDKESRNLIDQQTGQVLENDIMTRDLYGKLLHNEVPLHENFDALNRNDKIAKMCAVIGVTGPHDPDSTYELTTDNVKKMLAIYMRFRCDIPVIVMGETGCGKTRLIKFLCALQMPSSQESETMILMKVHGGTKHSDIVNKVKKAEKLAKENVRKHGNNVYTVLFFDEANTTECIGLIKEIICDKTMEGRKLQLCENLKFIAACNPYRKHSEDLIKKLEQAGLGYHVAAEATTDTLGRVPMRRLVYRVQPLPQSLLPLVWDFGQLNSRTEDLYIRQMVRRYIRDGKLPDMNGLVEVLSDILTASQDYMRDQKDECSFVSLRDADRALMVMSWFYHQLTNKTEAGTLLKNKNAQELPPITRALVLALGVCYHACLKNRDNYRNSLTRHFKQPCILPGGAKQMLEEIVCCQDVFLDNIELDKNIAKNVALKENVFMMAICIELRIPLFLVGKPGSSKSLAKTIVSDAMQGKGNTIHGQLFKDLKQVQMVSFQCSPLSTADGIVGTFLQCANFQKDKDLTKFASVVVLDEVGLAEDSPRMPLKTLHPLLEDGCPGDETPEPYMKVAFIGISNWALDPAKMNRGILVQREVPDIEELKNSAKGICSDDETVKRLMDNVIDPLAESYLDIFEIASVRREFFGLRDFYSLVKMVYSFVEKSKQKPSWFELQHSIYRNFGGLDEVDPAVHFQKPLSKTVNACLQRARPGDPECTQADLIEACLFDKYKTKSESRYLLLITENYGALSILQQHFFFKRKSSNSRLITIFGSSFPSDQEYTQVCRNINKIKVCMETGNTVILLNLENLYESLYDALNQYYVYFGGERYVDLGLGTHRVKCRVNREFRLIVVAEKQVVYKQFPIPLINRLEKHFLTTDAMLSNEQCQMTERFRVWIRTFLEQKKSQQRQFPHNATASSENLTAVGEAFMGYHEDTCSAIVLQVWKPDADERFEVLDAAKKMLLWCATPEVVVKVRKSNLSHDDQNMVLASYFQEQAHEGLSEYLRFKLKNDNTKELFAQVTTHSKLLSSADKSEIANATEIPNVMLETLQAFDTEQQFSSRIRAHLELAETKATILILQCDSGNIHGPLIAGARYCVVDEYQKVRELIRFPFHVVLIIQLPRIAGGSFGGFQCGDWHSVHIDDLRPFEEGIPTIQQMQAKSPGRLVGDAMDALDYPSTEDEIKETHGEGDTTYDDEEAEDYHIESTPIATPDLVEKEPEIKINGIIMTCLQPALSMVRDRSEDIGRTTKRVPYVLEFLQRPEKRGEPSFFTGVGRLIASIMQDKEKTGHSYMAENWLIEEAVQPHRIQKAGTFRRACRQVLESKIAPILAGIVAFLDTNHNLDLLKSTEEQWRQEMMLKVMNAPEILNLTYGCSQIPSSRNERQEAEVLATGCESHMFAAMLPFSWIVYETIESIIHAPQAGSADDYGGMDAIELLQLFERLLAETPLGKVLIMMDAEACRDSQVNSYLHDFVHFVYIAKSEDEHKLVCQSLKTEMSDRYQARDLPDDLLRALIKIHQCYRKVQKRLNYFRSVNVLWPECTSKLLEIGAEDRKQEIYTALGLLIQDMKPDNNDLNEEMPRSKWLGKVNRFRPLVENVMSLSAEESEIPITKKMFSMHKARCLWSQIQAVKLFIEHMCSTDETDRPDKITVKRCMPLFKLLEGASKARDVDFKDIVALETVEKFLKSCNKTAVKEFQQSQGKCGRCEKLLDEAPIILPCNHTVCEKCLFSIQQSPQKTCSTCHKEIGTDFDATTTDEKLSAEISKIKDYQKRCNAFFMDLVAQLCFAQNTPPTDQVIDKLLGYIVCTLDSDEPVTGKKVQLTKEFTIFDNSIDPNPVFRSFLLQLLLRTSGNSVDENLEKYLMQAQGLLQIGGREEHYIELCLMVIQSLEDISRFTTDETADSLSIATNRLRLSKQWIDSHKLNIEKLKAIAYARSALAVTAECINKVVSAPENISLQERKLLEDASNLCSGEDNWRKTYLVKYICRCYGIGTYQAVCLSDSPHLSWLRNEDRTKVVEGSDWFVVCGQQYIRVRESLTKVLLGENIAILDKSLQEADIHRSVPLDLAAHREISCKNLYPSTDRKILKGVGNFTKYCQETETLQTELALAVIQSKLGTYCRGLIVTEGVDLRQQALQGLLVHFLSVIHHSNDGKSIMWPLIGLMRRPNVFADTLIPTMPQDDLAEIKETLLSAIRTSDYNATIYQCPSGHPYVIGNCGRAWVQTLCNVCGAKIGGGSHQLLSDNVEGIGKDTTQTGHILKLDEVREQGALPERELTPMQCTCVRLFMHMALYLGAANGPEMLRDMFKPAKEIGDIPGFLYEHIEIDIKNLQKCLDRSLDDVCLLLHFVINSMMTVGRNGAGLQTDMMSETGTLTTKDGRKRWESIFSKTFIEPMQTAMEGILKDGYKEVSQDHRLGADPLLCLLHETAGSDENISPNQLQEIPSVWRYRTYITTEHLKREFESKIISEKGQTKQVILQMFLNQEQNLRAIKFIPSILKLHRILLAKYQRRLDRMEASDITIEQIRKDEVAGEDTERLISDFTAAWNIVKRSLETYVCPTKFGGAKLPEEICGQNITNTTPLSVLLPTMKDSGLCSFAMLDYLFRKQNDVLDQYMKLSKRKRETFSNVLPSDVTIAHLISYDLDQDILPMVLANCEYSFEIGKGTKIEYDFGGLQRQIIDRLLFPKSFIQIGHVMQIETMVFRTEFTNVSDFKTFSEKIQQERFTSTVGRQICAELRDLPDVCFALSNLDIAISFLNSVGGDPDNSLCSFMSDTLKMQNPLQSQTANQECRFKHTKALWLLLCSLRTKKLADNRQGKQGMFENVPLDFHEDMPPVVQDELGVYLHEMSIEKLEVLLDALHEFIRLVVSDQKSLNDPEYVDTADNVVRDWLYGHLEEQESPVMDADTAFEIPGVILYRHVVEFWVRGYKMLCEKQGR